MQKHTYFYTKLKYMILFQRSSLKNRNNIVSQQSKNTQVIIFSLFFLNNRMWFYFLEGLIYLSGCAGS